MLHRVELLGGHVGRLRVRGLLGALALGVRRERLVGERVSGSLDLLDLLDRGRDAGDSRSDSASEISPSGTTTGAAAKATSPERVGGLPRPALGGTALGDRLRGGRDGRRPQPRSAYGGSSTRETRTRPVSRT